MLILSDVSKSYGTRELFSEVSLRVAAGDRLGLVGANGAGKTTLFNVILGGESPDAGEIAWERGASVGFLPQESAAVGEETVLDLATAVSEEFVTVRAKLRRLGVLDGGPETPPGAEASAETSDDDFHELFARFEAHDGYQLEPRAKPILAGLGFREGDFNRQARTLSGGWIMRAHLARLLVQQPDLLMLDEPTNHLDLESLLWFQDYLTRYPGAIVMISHDRAFLNALTTGILELRQRRLFRYTGNYDSFLTQKAAQEEQQRSAFKNQQREIAKLQLFVDRFGAKASMASRAKSKEKQIERLQEDAVDAPAAEARKVSFRFPQPPRSGLRVIALKEIRQAYGDRVVYSNLNYEAERGERVALVGPNGAGKSTLLKLLAGVLPFQAGERELGHNVTAGYFAQQRLETLNPKATVLEDALEARPDPYAISEETVRTLLGAFLFQKDDVFKPISVLSGGEKTRLALAKLLLAPPNLLLMDEPTTHLDIASIDALVRALEVYEGTLLFISHDVHFIRSIANRVVHVSAGRLTRYAGGYDYYLDKSGAASARAGLTAGAAGSLSNAQPVAEKRPAAAPAGGGFKSKDQRRAEADARSERTREKRRLTTRLAEVEAALIEAENRQKELAAQLENATAGAARATLSRELGGVAARIDELNAEWETLGARIGALEAAG